MVHKPNEKHSIVRSWTSSFLRNCDWTMDDLESYLKNISTCFYFLDWSFKIESRSSENVCKQLKVFQVSFNWLKVTTVDSNQLNWFSRLESVLFSFSKFQATDFGQLWLFSESPLSVNFSRSWKSKLRFFNEDFKLWI